MFTFTDEELSLAPKMRSLLIPPHMRTEQEESVEQTTDSAEMSATQPNEGNNETTAKNETTDSAALPSTAEEGP
jgi:hypothetical protein